MNTMHFNAIVMTDDDKKCNAIKSILLNQGALSVKRPLNYKFAFDFLREKDPDIPFILLVDRYMNEMNAVEFAEELAQIPEEHRHNTLLFVLADCFDAMDVIRLNGDKNINGMLFLPYNKATGELIQNLLFKEMSSIH